MITPNRKIGNTFESDLCELLYEHGYWAHNLAQNASGQPADVIAVKSGTSYLIDCKVCRTNRFSIARMEENQDLSMELWKSCGNGEGWFAVLIGGQVYMIKHSVVKCFKNRQSYMSEADIKTYGTLIGEWLE